MNDDNVALVIMIGALLILAIVLGYGAGKSSMQKEAVISGHAVWSENHEFKWK